MVKCKLVLQIVGGVVNIRLEVIRVQRFQMIILEQLDSFSVVVDLHSGDEYLAFDFPVEGRPHSHNHSHIIISF